MVIAVGVLLLLGLIVGLVFWRKKKAAKDDEDSSHDLPHDDGDEMYATLRSRKSEYGNASELIAASSASPTIVYGKAPTLDTSTASAAPTIVYGKAPTVAPDIIYDKGL